MSERDEPVGDPWLEDPEQRLVADLLAAEPAPPMPDDVADRLQAAIRAESDARATAPRHPAPASLDAHRGRRRRRLVTGLAAAAVVVGVVAVGGTVLTQPQGADRSTVQDDAGAGGSAESAPDSGDLKQAPAAPPAPARSGAVRVDDLADLPAGALPRALPSTGGAVFACTGGGLELGAPDLAVPAVLRGAPVWIVRTSRPGGDLVSALSCVDVPDGGEAIPVETATLR